MTVDPVRRLAVIAAGVPDAVLVEAVLDAPYEAIWELASDLERGVPRFEPTVRSVQIVKRDGERLRIILKTQTGLRVPMAVVLRDGYCLMQSENASIGMAARAEGTKTRFAHFESLPGLAVHEAKLINELRTLEALARAGA